MYERLLLFRCTSPRQEYKQGCSSMGTTRRCSGDVVERWAASAFLSHVSQLLLYMNLRYPDPTCLETWGLDAEFGHVLGRRRFTATCRVWMQFAVTMRNSLHAQVVVFDKRIRRANGSSS